MSWAGLTWTIKSLLTEDVLSWLAWLEQSNQCWLKMCWAELADLTWAIKWNGLSMPVHQASSLLRCRRLFSIRLTHTSPITFFYFVFFIFGSVGRKLNGNLNLIDLFDSSWFHRFFWSLVSRWIWSSGAYFICFLSPLVLHIMKCKIDECLTV